MKKKVVGFYRPNKWKIILTVIIMILHISLSFYAVLFNFCIENFDGYHINDCPEPSLIQKILIPTALPFLAIIIFSEAISFLYPISLILGLGVLLFLWYTLSCFAYLIKSKISKK